ncbi:DUF11 domain-containing protein [Allosphingosinicella vermicomposti]|uniref:DUF11 domain-containing protein n=1 Tax=Allosphingosinicella vermicomposti TaxID=614671 RepID=UPI000D0E9D89|nr:DUF11 domain-containing protein [Allosphingosinicella vermicomposti]
MKYALALLAALLPASAFANNVQLESQVFVERIVTGPDGKEQTALQEPKVVTPGEKLVFELNYKNTGSKPADDFVVTNPMPAAVSYAGGESDGSVVSVDGGKTWGPLASLKVAGTDGVERAAQASDVTHVRWTFAQAIPAGAQGKLTFRGTVK